MTRLKHDMGRGGHVRLYWDMLDSMAWRALSWVEQGLYIAMRRKLKGTNNGNIEATLATLKHAGITSPATLSKGLKSLQAVGFIAKTRQGGIAYGSKVCSLYRFTDEQTFEHPKLGVEACKATNDWQRFKTLSEARSAIKAAQTRPAGARNENAE